MNPFSVGKTRQGMKQKSGVDVNLFIKIGIMQYGYRNQKTLGYKTLEQK